MITIIHLNSDSLFQLSGLAGMEKNLAIDILSRFAILLLIPDNINSFESILMITSIFIISFLIIVFTNVTFGNIAPTIISQKNIAGVAVFTAIPFRIFNFCFYPIIISLKFISEMMLKTLGISHSDDAQTQIVQDEIKYLIDESSKLSSFDEIG